MGGREGGREGEVLILFCGRVFGWSLTQQNCTDWGSALTHPEEEWRQIQHRWRGEREIERHGDRGEREKKGGEKEMEEADG